MRPTFALLVLWPAVAVAGAQQAAAQGSRDGADARTDALLGTPNKATPVPQTNRFPTSPGLEQQAPGPQARDLPKDSGAAGAPAGKQP